MGKLRLTGWVIETELGGEEGGFVQQPDEVLDVLASFIFRSSLLQFNDDWVVWVDFHSLLGDHVAGHGGVSKQINELFL